MRYILILLGLFSFPALATITKSPASCGSHPCTITLTCASATCNGTENTELQTTLDDTTIQRGDTVVMQAGRTWAGNFTFTRSVSGSSGYISFTSSLSSLCPASGSRVTPSHQPNMPTISNGGGTNGSPTLQVVGGSGTPSYLSFDCIEFINQQSSGSGSGSDALRIGGDNLTDTSQLPHDLVLRHLYIHGAIGDDSYYSRNGTTCNGSNITIADSFIYEIKSDIESHASSCYFGAGTLDVSNNFLQAAAIPILQGGAWQTIRTDPAQTSTYSYNYLWKPNRWKTANVAVKTMMEFKVSTTSTTAQYNVFANNFRNTHDDQATTAFAANARYNGPIFTGAMLSVNTGTDVISSSDSSNLHLTTGDIILFSNVDGGTVPAGLTVCVSSAPCYAISVTATSLKVSTTAGGSAIDITSTGSGNYYMLAIESWAGTRNVTIQNNVIAGSFGSWATLQSDSGLSDLVLTKNCHYKNNLFYDIGLNYDTTPPSGQYSYTGLLVETANGADCTIENQTTVPSGTQNPPLASTRNIMIGNGLGKSSLTYKNNLDPGGEYSWKSDMGAYDTGIVNSFASGSVVQNSTMVGLSSGNFAACSPVTCSGLQYPTGAQWDANYMQFNNPATHDYSLKATSPYYTASTTGGPIGVDTTTLPILSSVSVTPSSVTASLAFTMSAPINAATSTQPCILEASTSDNLTTQAGTYTVINALNPTMFVRQDSSAASTVFSLAGATGTWQIGINDSANDVNGVSRDRRLSPSTTYYYRLQCYGDTVTGYFSTTSGATSSRTLSGSVRLTGRAN